MQVILASPVSCSVAAVVVVAPALVVSVPVSSTEYVEASEMELKPTLHCPLNPVELPVTVCGDILPQQALPLRCVARALKYISQFPSLESCQTTPALPTMSKETAG